MDDLKDDFHVRAVNLYGYGRTPPWFSDAPQSLEDQAHLGGNSAADGRRNLFASSATPSAARSPMELPAGLSGRISRLVLQETNPSISSNDPVRRRHLPRSSNCAIASRNSEHSASGQRRPNNSPTIGGGAGSWQNMSTERRIAHCQLKRPWYARRVGGAAARVGELLCTPITLPRSSRAGPEKSALGPLS
jgi:hypothetical protein